MLKLIAMLLMLIDHTALVFLPITHPLYIICRLVGRLAMPIFAYKIASGFIYTRHLNKYIKRVGLMTLCAQIPFILMITGLSFSKLFTLSGLSILLSRWNVGLTFICALLILKFYRELSESSTKYPLLHTLFILLLGLIAGTADYGLYGVMMVISFYIFLRHSLTYTEAALLLIGCTLLNYLPQVAAGDFDSLLIQLPCILGILLIKIIPDTKPPLGNMIWYSFYPLHMFILSMIALLVF